MNFHFIYLSVAAVLITSTACSPVVVQAVSLHQGGGESINSTTLTTSMNPGALPKEDVSSRLKRQLWYHWRGTRNKYYIPLCKLPNRPPPQNAVHSNLQKMVNFIAERLKLADKVAVNKWDNNLPVEDIPREQIILENMVKQAENRGLDPTWAYRFFRAQIEANKDIQFELIRMWQLQGRRPYGPPVDLANDVRPQIDLINDKLMELAKLTEPERREWRCKLEVEKDARYAAFLYNLDQLHQKALQRATANVCILPRESYPD